VAELQLEEQILKVFSNVQERYLLGRLCPSGHEEKGKQDGSQLCSSRFKKNERGWTNKMVQRKMGRYWSKEKGWQVSRVWKKICQWFKTEVSEVRTTCKSHTDDKVAKGECCREKAPSPKHWP